MGTACALDEYICSTVGGTIAFQAAARSPLRQPAPHGADLCYWKMFTGPGGRSSGSQAGRDVQARMVLERPLFRPLSRQRRFPGRERPAPAT
jgi:hypothetical protein